MKTRLLLTQSSAEISVEMILFTEGVRIMGRLFVNVLLLCLPEELVSFNTQSD